MGSRRRKTTTTRRREKRQERREEREERREKTEDRPQEAARGPQMRPPEGGQPFSTPCRPGLGPLATSRIAAFLQGGRPRGLIIPCKNAGILFRESSAEERSDDGAEKREKRKEKRENGHQLDSLHFYGVPWPPQRSYENPMGAPK